MYGSLPLTTRRAAGGCAECPTNPGSATEGVTALVDGGRNYYLHVFRYLAANTNYHLTTFADTAGTVGHPELGPTVTNEGDLAGEHL